MSSSPRPQPQPQPPSHRASLPPSGTPSVVSSTYSNRHSLVPHIAALSIRPSAASTPDPLASTSSPSSVFATAAAAGTFSGPPLSSRRFIQPGPAATSSKHPPAIRNSIYSKPILAHSSSGSTSAARTGSSLLSNNVGSNPLEVGLVAFEFLFAEIVRYTQQRVDGIGEFEKKLNILGYHVGIRLLALLSLREALVAAMNTGTSVNAFRSASLAGATGNIPPRLTRLVPVLSWIHTTIWKTVVGKTADVLEHSNENADEYMISDNDLLLTRAITIPKEMSQLSCGAIMAGVVEGCLDGLGFPARVTSHSAPSSAFPKLMSHLLVVARLVKARRQSTPISRWIYEHKTSNEILTMPRYSDSADENGKYDAQVVTDLQYIVEQAVLAEESVKSSQ